MSKFVSPHLGKITQSSGGVTFSTWKSINVMKAKAETVANPKTIGQQQNRTKFTGVVKYARQILGALRLTLKSAAIKKSEYNVFVGDNVSFIDNTTGIFDVANVSLLVLAKGTLENVITPRIVDASAPLIEMQWSITGYLPTTSPTDIITIYCYNATLDTFVYSDDKATRQSGTGSFVTPSNFDAGHVLYVWIQATDAANKASNNYYVGTVTMA